MKTSIKLILIILGISLPGHIHLEAQQIMRFPDISEKSVVFVSGEDIWSAPLEGGDAMRLTIHDGNERYPKFSPDGSLIAFTGEYDGNTDVYVMNSKGGNITRITYHPGADEVVGWHPESNKIIFNSARNSTSRYTKLFLISPDGTGLEELILYDASRGSFSPDGKKIAYNKVSREHRTWKRYQGGKAQEIYIYDFETSAEENISNFRGTDRMPMWIGNKVYFVSDRDGTLNIFSYHTVGKEINQLTTYHDYDILRASAGENKIVYEKGGNLWLLDINTEKTSKIDITIHPDAPETRPYMQTVADNLQDFHISPSGMRALVVARGEIFSVPKSSGITRNISNNCGARDKDAAWSNNGQKIAFADQTLRCYILDVKSREVIEVDKANYEHVDESLHHKGIYDYSWSPDSKYLAYSKMNRDLVCQIYIYSLEENKVYPISDGLYDDFNPVFTRDGEHLLFVSNRKYHPTFCDKEWEMVYKDLAGIYAFTLKKNGKAH